MATPTWSPPISSSSSPKAWRSPSQLAPWRRRLRADTPSRRKRLLRSADGARPTARLPSGVGGEVSLPVGAKPPFPCRSRPSRRPGSPSLSRLLDPRWAECTSARQRRQTPGGRQDARRQPAAVHRQPFCLTYASGSLSFGGDSGGVLGLVCDELQRDLVPRLQVGVPAKVGKVLALLRLPLPDAWRRRRWSGGSSHSVGFCATRPVRGGSVTISPGRSGSTACPSELRARCREMIATR